MRRRKFITLFGVAALAGPHAARAQQVDRLRRVGVLMSRAVGDPEEQARFAGFLQGLQKLGWTDGRNVRIDYRWAAAEADRSRTYAAPKVIEGQSSPFLPSGTCPKKRRGRVWAGS